MRRAGTREGGLPPALGACRRLRRSGRALAGCADIGRPLRWRGTR